MNVPVYCQIHHPVVAQSSRSSSSTQQCRFHVPGNNPMSSNCSIIFSLSKASCCKVAGAFTFSFSACAFTWDASGFWLRFDRWCAGVEENGRTLVVVAGRWKRHCRRKGWRGRIIRIGRCCDIFTVWEWANAAVDARDALMERGSFAGCRLSRDRVGGSVTIISRLFSHCKTLLPELLHTARVASNRFA